MQDFFCQPDKEVIIDLVGKLLRIVFPGYYRDKSYKIYDINNHLSTITEDITYRLIKQLVIVLPRLPELNGKSEAEIREKAEEISIAFLDVYKRQIHGGRFLVVDVVCEMHHN